MITLTQSQSPDIICLQETKLQTENVKDFQNILDGYITYWLCSEVKKGYSGTVIFNTSININSIQT